MLSMLVVQEDVDIDNSMKQVAKKTNHKAPNSILENKPWMLINQFRNTINVDVIVPNVRSS